MANPLTALSEHFEQLLSADPSQRRKLLKGWGLLIVLAVGLFAAFEWHTHYFRLNRLDTQVQIASDLEEAPLDKRGEAYLDSIQIRLEQELLRSVEDAGSLPDVPPRPIQSFVALLPWVLLGLFFKSLPAVGEPVEWATGMAMVAVPFSLLAAAMPPSWHPLFRYLLIPFGGSIIVVVAVTKLFGD